jgi:hypothetical protein
MGYSCYKSVSDIAERNTDISGAVGNVFPPIPRILGVGHRAEIYHHPKSRHTTALWKLSGFSSDQAMTSLPDSGKE